MIIKKKNINLLIQNGAEVNCEGTYGYIPLMVASMNGYDNIVKLLIN